MLDERYPAPHAENLWSRDFQVGLWHEITCLYASLKIREEYAMPLDEVPPDEMRGVNDEGHRLLLELDSLKCPPPEAVATRESYTGHEITAFLQLFTEQMSDGLKRHIHYGLTSQDLVDYHLFQALQRHADILWKQVAALRDSMMREDEWNQINPPRAGRTHGQTAAVTSWHYQRIVINNVLERIQTDIRKFSGHLIFKSPGPTGASRLVSMRGFTAAMKIGDTLPVTSTQVVPRDYLIEWAALYLRLSLAMENLALQVRLGARSEIGEFSEGARRDGSSAMPHKKNPITSEKVCGLARIARGQFMALSESVALWEDRDLSNSSTERVAVPTLAATVEHQVTSMTEVMSRLVVHTGRMVENAEDPACYTDLMQALIQKYFPAGPIEASALVKRQIEKVENRDPRTLPVWIKAVRVGLEATDPEAALAWSREVSHIASGR